MIIHPKRLTGRQTLLVGSMLFGMFFGAGNLIFPIHLGQLAGRNAWQSALGFITTGAVLPFLAIAAIAMTRSTDIYDLAEPIGKRYATGLMLVMCLTIGPVFALPRLATVPFSVGFANYLPPQHRSLGLLIYSVLFFGITYWFCRKPSKIVDYIGKYLNPIFIAMLGILLIWALIRPMGVIRDQLPVPTYLHDAFTQGFLQGYNTMDAIAGLVFGIVIINAVRGFGVDKPTAIAGATFKSGLVSLIGMGLIYALLVLVGAMSLGKFPRSANGGIALSQITNYYFGSIGSVILMIMITLACLKTAIGLVAAFVESLHTRFKRFSYQQLLVASILLALVIANLGLNQIIAWSNPALLVIYPLAITLIFVSLLDPIVHRSAIIYRTVTIFTLVPAIIDGLVNLPIHAGWLLNLRNFEFHYFPFAAMGLGWTIPALIGLIVGFILQWIFKQNKNVEPNH